MFTFDKFEVGATYGSCRFHVSREMVEAWRKLYPEDETASFMPPGMASVITMHAYGSIITPRPPGNIHGNQRFEFKRLPRVDETLDTTIRCEAKEERKGRHVVHLIFETRAADGEVVLIGRFTSIVAA